VQNLPEIVGKDVLASWLQLRKELKFPILCSPAGAATMNRLPTALIPNALILTAVLVTPLATGRSASAQYIVPHHPAAIDRVTLVQLDRLADQLADIAAHLHEDSHQLSPHYFHSAAIEAYVVELEELQRHLHLVLHQAVNSNSQSRWLITHVRSDLSQTRQLLNRLYAELHHQGLDGACPEDLRLIAHMRRIITRQAFPLMETMEAELSGTWPRERSVIRSRAVPRHVVPVAPQPIQSGSVTWRGFRISF
jgi:hypothetical protein